MGTKHICLPFPSEAQYRAYVDDPAQYRQYLTQMLRQYPELFPKDMGCVPPFTHVVAQAFEGLAL